MKRFLTTLAVAALGLASPIISYAQQTDQPVTHAQLREELRLLEQAAYCPACEDFYYPNNIRAALERIHKNQGLPTQNAGGSGNSQ
jgi:hypothetical protein